MSDVTATWQWIDGDPDEVASHSAYYAGIADAVRATVTNLHAAIDTSATVSDAVTAFSEVAAKVASSLGEVDDRYRVIADQLARFSSELRRIQDQANATQSYARTAWDDRLSAVARRDESAFMMGQVPAEDSAAGEYHTDYLRERGLVREYDADIAARQRELDELIDEWRAVADDCARAISDVVKGSDLNDSGWDRFLDWAETVLPIIQLVIDIAAIVLTVLAFVLVFTGAGAAFAPLLFALARGLQVVSKVISVVRALITCAEVMTGRKSPMALAGIAVDVVAGKVGGKAMDGVVNRLGGSRAKSFDEWVTGEFRAEASLPRGPALDGTMIDFEDIAQGLIDGPSKKLDEVLDIPFTAIGFGNEATGLGKAFAAVGSFVGDGSATSDLAWQVVTAGNDLLSTTGVTPDLLTVPDVYGKEATGEQWQDFWAGHERRPSADAVVAAL